MEPKRILFLSLQGSMPPHQAGEAELMLQYAREGAEVHLLSCDAQLLSCRYNFTHQPVVCATCEANCQRSADVVGIPAANRHRISRALFPATLEGELPRNTAELLTFEYEGVNVGRGVAATCISLLRDHDLRPRSTHRDLITHELRNAVGAARNYRKLLRELQPSEVLVFNGRHVQCWPMVDLCQKLNVTWHTHEAGANLQRYQLFPHSLPHSIETRRNMMVTGWRNADPATRVEVAENWFRSRRAGTNTDDKVYVGQQRRGSLPPTFDPELHNIVIFNSSEDEMKTIVEWATPLYASQNEAIRRVIADTAGEGNLHVTLRIHPNLRTIDNQQTRELKELNAPHLTVVAADDPVDTYELMQAADVVLTFGSSTGIEATFWGVPSILLGHSFYEGQRAVYEARDFDHLRELLNTRLLPPQPRENTYPYALYVLTCGKPFEHLTVNAGGRGRYGTESLQAGRKRQRSYHLKYAKYYPAWLRLHLNRVKRWPRRRDLKRRTDKKNYQQSS